MNGLMEVLGVERIIHSNDAFWSFDIESFELNSSEFKGALIFSSVAELYILVRVSLLYVRTQILHVSARLNLTCLPTRQICDISHSATAPLSVTKLCHKSKVVIVELIWSAWDSA